MATSVEACAPTFSGLVLLMQLSELTPAQLRQAANIKEQIDQLQSELQALLGAQPTATNGGKLHWTQTPEGAARMAQIRARRWQKSGRRLTHPATSPQGQTKPHWTQTPEGKARIARAMRASWRKRRAA